MSKNNPKTTEHQKEKAKLRLEQAILNKTQCEERKKIIIGFYWESSDYIFKSYVQPLRKAKSDQDVYAKNNDPRANASLRSMVKLYLNSLSGKVAQREYDVDISFCFSDLAVNKFMDLHTDVTYSEIPSMNCIKLEGVNTKYEYKEKKAKPAHLAAFIYSYAREHMYRAVLSRTEEKFFTDTDSCHMTEVEIQRLYDKYQEERKSINDDLATRFGKFNFGGEFGDFEKEIDFEVSRYYSIAPKCYAMFSDNSPKKKLRFKGINQGKDKILEQDIKCEKEYRKNIVKAFNEKEISDHFEMYENLPVACSELLYENLSQNKCVSILTSHIERTTGCESIASLHQSFMIKTIRCGENLVISN